MTLVLKVFADPIHVLLVFGVKINITALEVESIHTPGDSTKEEFTGLKRLIVGMFKIILYSNF